MEAKKLDSNKIDKSLVCPHADDLRMLVFGFGAGKYGKHNFLNGGDNWTHTRLLAACLRHIHSHLSGESLDPESGLPHLAHASCCLDMLMECWVLGTVKDDRSEVMRSKHIDTLAWLAQGITNIAKQETPENGSKDTVSVCGDRGPSLSGRVWSGLDTAAKKYRG